MPKSWRALRFSLRDFSYRYLAGCDIRPEPTSMGLLRFEIIPDRSINGSRVASCASSSQWPLIARHAVVTTLSWSRMAYSVSEISTTQLLECFKLLSSYVVTTNLGNPLFFKRYAACRVFAVVAQCKVFFGPTTRSRAVPTF